MLQPWEDPKIENVGTIKDPIWDFYIPRGFTGEHAVHVGPEDPVTFRNSHLDDADIQEAYKNAEQMIWVDTKNKADFDHLNAVYHAYKEKTGDTAKTIIASTASPYKFGTSVMSAIDEKYKGMDDFALIDELEKVSGTKVPKAVEEIRSAPVLHDTVCETEDMQKTVEEILGL